MEHNNNNPENEPSLFEQNLTEQGMQRRLNWIDLLICLLSIAILYLATGYGTYWMASILKNERILIYLSGFLTQGMFLIVILVLKGIRRLDWKTLGWSRVGLRSSWADVLRLYILTWVINLLYMSYLLKNGFTPPETDVYNKLLGNPTILTYVLNLLLAVVLAPIMEETIFRGVVFKSLQTYFGKWTSAIISSLVFSGLHFQIYGLFPRFMLGMILAYLYDKHKSLYPSMALHAINNLVAVVLAGLVTSEMGLLLR